jgi:archaellum biogenesis ATPase FlaH
VRVTNDNPFIRFARAGYAGRLLPIVQPGADISPNSSLARPERQKDIGKTPGVRGVHGWHGLPDWQKVVSTDAMHEAWGTMDAGVGMKMGEGLIAVDIDCMDADKAHICAQTATEILGPSDNRVGRKPKRAKLYRVSEPVPYSRITFDGGHVEVLSDGKQLVVHGIHPATGLPYEWPRGVPRYEDLPIVDGALVAKYMAALADRLPAAKVDVSSLPADRKVSDPAQLTGHVDHVRKAMEALPNNFDDRQTYINVAQALKGALPDDPETAFELFDAWAAKWPDYNAATTAADWRRTKPSHSLGAAYLYSLASTHAKEHFSAAETWFDAVPAGQEIGLNPFEVADGTGEAQEQIEPIRWARPSEWVGEPPPREWEVRDWIPKGEVVLLYGEGGVGKTLLAHQYAIAAATGTPWLGQETRQARVMCFFCEDSIDELHRRHVDISRSLGVAPGAGDDRLRITSRKYMDNLLALWDRNTGAMRKTAVWKQLRDDALLFGADVLIVDTLADTFGGSEIDRTQVNSFIKSCLGRLAEEAGATVIALGHPSVAGRTEGRSGSTAWSNAARSRLFLRYPKGKETGNWRELEGMKLNYGPKGNQIRLEWKAGAFSAWGKPRGQEIGLNALNGSVGPVVQALPAVEDIAERAVLECLSWAEADQMPLSLSPGSRTYAPRILKENYGQSLDMLKLDDVRAAIVALQKRNVIRPASWWTGGRNRASGFVVVTAGALD